MKYVKIKAKKVKAARVRIKTKPKTKPKSRLRRFFSKARVRFSNSKNWWKKKLPKTLKFMIRTVFTFGYYYFVNKATIDETINAFRGNGFNVKHDGKKTSFYKGNERYEAYQKGNYTYCYDSNAKDKFNQVLDNLDRGIDSTILKTRADIDSIKHDTNRLLALKREIDREYTETLVELDQTIGREIDKAFGKTSSVYTRFLGCKTKIIRAKNNFMSDIDRIIASKSGSGFNRSGTSIDKALKIMGLTRNDLTLEKVKSKYRELAMKYHPDKNQGNKQAEEQFKKINNANDILMKHLKSKMAAMIASFIIKNVRRNK